MEQAHSERKSGKRGRALPTYLPPAFAAPRYRLFAAGQVLSVLGTWIQQVAMSWLVFRIMLGAGLIKLRGDACWTDLTCLDFHFETQPIPNPLSPLFHGMPHWLLAGGVLFLGFGGMRATAQFAENYLAFLFYIGARLFVLYLLLGVGITIMQNQIASMSPAMTPPQMGELLAMSVIFAAITLRVPTSIASRVAGSGSFGIAQALRSL